jgi:hypothetical protein
MRLRLQVETWDNGPIMDVVHVVQCSIYPSEVYRAVVDVYTR